MALRGEKRHKNNCPMADDTTWFTPVKWSCSAVTELCDTKIEQM